MTPGMFYWTVLNLKLITLSNLREVFSNAIKTTLLRRVLAYSKDLLHFRVSQPLNSVSGNTIPSVYNICVL